MANSTSFAAGLEKVINDYQTDGPEFRIDEDPDYNRMPTAGPGELTARGVSRRKVLKAGAIGAASTVISSILDDTLYAAENQNAPTIRRIKAATSVKDGVQYLKVGNLDLRIVDPNQTKAPAEYVDTTNSGVPLVEITPELLAQKVTNNFYLIEYARVQKPEYLAGTGVETQKVNVTKDGKTTQVTCWKYMRLDPGIVERVQNLRDKQGSSVKILSVWRPKTYNEKVYRDEYGNRPMDEKAIRAMKYSKHIAGLAVDCTSTDIKLLRQNAIAISPYGGLGIKYNTFIHMDCRPYTPVVRF